MEMTEIQPTKKRGRPRKSEALLPGAKYATVATTVRIYDLAEKIVKEGMGRMACIKYAKEEWGLSDTQAERYYYGALGFLKPEDEEKYREALIARNFGVLEGLLQKAIDANDVRAAADVVKIMNQMLGVGSKSVEINDGKNNVIKVSFGD